MLKNGHFFKLLKFDDFFTTNKDTHKYLKMDNCDFEDIYDKFKNGKLLVKAYPTPAMSMRIKNN